MKALCNGPQVDSTKKLMPVRGGGVTSERWQSGAGRTRVSFPRSASRSMQSFSSQRRSRHHDFVCHLKNRASLHVVHCGSSSVRIRKAFPLRHLPVR